MDLTYPELLAVERITRAKVRERWPEPTGDLMDNGGPLELEQVPYPSAEKQAAMVERFLNYGDKYVVMIDRWEGTNPFSNVKVPDTYMGKGPEDQFVKMFNQMSNDAGMCLVFPGRHIGTEFRLDWNTPPVAPITQLEFEWTPSIEQAAVRAAVEDPGIWMNYLTTGPALAQIGVEQQVVYIGDGDNDPVEYTSPAMQAPLSIEPRRTENLIDLPYLAIDMILWGKCKRPPQPYSPLNAYAPAPLPLDDSYWIKWIEITAGRILWQMAYVEYMLMVDDMMGQNTGGRGGLPGGLRPMTPIIPPKKRKIRPDRPITPKRDTIRDMLKFIDTANQINGWLDDAAAVILGE